MIETYRRPMTEAERSLVSDALLKATESTTLDPLEWLWRGIGSLLLGAVVGVFFAGFLAIWDLPAFWLCLSLIFAATVGLLVGIVGAARAEAAGQSWRKEYAASLARQLVRGDVEVTRVVASDAAVVWDQGEEGAPAFLFDIGGGRILFLSEIYDFLQIPDQVTDPMEYGLFTAFDVVRYADATGRVLGVYPHGPSLPVSRILYWSGDDVFDDGRILTAVSLATVEKDLPDMLTTESYCD